MSCYKENSWTNVFVYIFCCIPGVHEICYALGGRDGWTDMTGQLPPNNMMPPVTLWRWHNDNIHCKILLYYVNTHLVNWSNICEVDESISRPSNSEAVVSLEQENICLNVQQKLEITRKIYHYLQNSQTKLWITTIFGIPRIATEYRPYTNLIDSSQRQTFSHFENINHTLRSFIKFIYCFNVCNHL